MTLTELTALGQWLETKWGRSKEWTDPAKHYNEFQYLPAPVVWQAARDIFRTGAAYCPKPSALYAAALHNAAPVTRIQPDPATCTHRWGVWPDALNPPDGRRLSVCVICKTEQYSYRSTQGEWEERHQAARGPAEPPDPSPAPLEEKPSEALRRLLADMGKGTEFPEEPLEPRGDQ